MRITDLLDKRSISLDAVPADKKATLDMAVELMAKSGTVPCTGLCKRGREHHGNRRRHCNPSRQM